MISVDRALALLEDNNLVWSSDFELVRTDLVALLDAYRRGDRRQVFFELRELAERLGNVEDAV